MIRLPQRQRAAARPNAQRLHSSFPPLVEAEQMAQRLHSRQPPAHSAPAVAASAAALPACARSVLRSCARCVRAPRGDTSSISVSLSRMQLSRCWCNRSRRSSDDRPGFQRAAPRFEFINVLGDNRFGAGNFRFARFLVLLHDLAQIIDVVEIQIVEPRRGFRPTLRGTPRSTTNTGVPAARRSRVPSSRASEPVPSRSPKSR